MPWSGGTSTPWDTMWSTNPMAAMADPSRLWGMGAQGVAPWAEQAATAMIPGLEAWRWGVNVQVDFALATLNMMRSMAR